MDPRLVAIVDEFVRVVESVPQDLSGYQRGYDTPEDLIADLRDHADRMRRGDTSRLPEFRFLLAPTGDLQEISIDSGWGDYFVELANGFDTILNGDPTPPSS